MRPGSSPQKPAQQTFIANSKSNFVVMIALALPFSFMLSAFTVSTAALYLEHRHAQAVTDLAAIAAAGNMDSAEQIITSIFANNDLGRIHISQIGQATPPTPDRPVVTVIRGHYTPDGKQPHARRFKSQKQPYNAVQITLHTVSHLFFGDGLVTPPIIRTRAVASNRGHNIQSGLSIGEPTQGAPWLAGGEENEVAWSAQARAHLDATASPFRLSSSPPPLQTKTAPASRPGKAIPVLVQ
ncbi:TadG family pilus assembly protein [Aquamicrobium segne]|uniref:TadG family pilus assembly protein n=1 Tax=Aquamicrobium segne TaxID=469547 RepID=A0ABW0GUL8_9HYPH